MKKPNSLISTAVAAGLLFNACSGNATEDSTNSEQLTVPETYPMPTEAELLRPERQELTEYLAHPAREKIILNHIQAYSIEVIDMALHDEPANTQFFDFESMEFVEDQSVNSPRWVQMQYNRTFETGAEVAMSSIVWVDQNLAVDPSKGFLSFGIEFSKNEQVDYSYRIDAALAEAVQLPTSTNTKTPQSIFTEGTITASSRNAGNTFEAHGTDCVTIGQLDFYTGGLLAQNTREKLQQAWLEFCEIPDEFTETQLDTDSI